MKQVIIAHEFLMPDAGTMRLKGFGLGAFGITWLETFLESVFLQVLEEVLHITRPNKIKKIELLNFPSVMNRYSRESGDIDYYMEHSGGIKIPENSVKKYGEVELVHVLAPSLEKTEDIYLSTQICGDSMALPGNEATIGYPPSTSDEAGMYYALGGIQSMSEQTTLSPPELSAKILVTNGVIAHHLNGNKAEIDFSSIEYGHFTEKTVLKTRPLPREQAIQAMDHANMTYGTVASIQEENGYWRTIISVSPDFDRQSLFGTKDS